jgi:hypothetical protein
MTAAVYGKAWDRTPPAPTARWETRDLMTSLANAGWGELAGRAMQGVRSTLHALVATLPYGSGAGKATAYDVSLRTGLSLKWTTRCLHLLEDLGIVEWTRGGITIDSASQRKGTPGWFRIVKRQLVALVLAARPLNDERIAAYRAETLKRIREIKTRYSRTRIKNQNRRSHHVELSGDPAPLAGGPGGTPPRTSEELTTQALIEAPAAPDPVAADAAAPLSETSAAALATIREQLAIARRKFQ